MDLPARSIQSTTRSHKLFLNLCKTDHISPTKICTIFTPFPPIAPRTKRWLDGELSNWHRDWPEFNIDAEEINAEPEPLLLDNYRA